MQKKHLIAFTTATIFLLLGFNLVSSYFHENRRAALVDDDLSKAINSETQLNDKIAAQPLADQPKAIIENASSQIEQAQKLEQQRLEQMDNAQ